MPNTNFVSRSTNITADWLNQINNHVFASSTLAAIRSLSKTIYSRTRTLGYYTAGDGGAGEYYLDPSDITSSDNGGTIIVASDGGRWKLLPNASTGINVKQFGAKGDGVTDDTAKIVAAIAAAKLFGISRVDVPGANFIITGPVPVKAGVCLSATAAGVESSYKSTVTSSAPIGAVFKMRGLTAQFQMEDNSAVEGITVWYDQQSYAIATDLGQPDNLTPWVDYAPAFQYVGNYSSIRLERILILGATRFFYSSETNQLEKAVIRDIRGFPLLVGIEIGLSTDVCYFQNIHFNPNSMYQLPGYTATTFTASKFTRNIVAFRLGRVDSAFIDNCFTYAVRDFVHLYYSVTLSGGVGGSVRINNSAADVVSTFLRVDFTQRGFGIAAVNCWAAINVFTIYDPSGGVVSRAPALLRYGPAAGASLENCHVELVACKTFGQAVAGIPDTARAQEPIRFEAPAALRLSVIMAACEFDEITTITSTPDYSQLVIGLANDKDQTVTARGCHARNTQTDPPIDIDFSVGSAGTTYRVGLEQRQLYAGSEGTAYPAAIQWTGRTFSDATPMAMDFFRNDGTTVSIMDVSETVASTRKSLLRVDKGTGDVVLGGGTYASNRFRLGAHFIWVDASGRLRIKSSAPSSDTDGTIVGTQT